MPAQELTLVQQAMTVISAILMYIIILVGVGPVVDMFVYEIIPEMDLLPWAQKMTNEFLIFGQWFYLLIKLAMAFVVLWFFLVIFQRYRYIRQEDEYDFYK
jgi:hypothetical protein